MKSFTGTRYVYTKTPDTRGIPLRSNLTHDTVRIHGFTPQDERALIAIHPVGAAFRLKLWPSEMQKIFLVSPCCYARASYITEEGEAKDAVLATWELELLYPDVPPGHWGCSVCHEPMGEASRLSSVIDGNESVEELNRVSAFIEAWLDAHGAPPLESGLMASDLQDEFEQVLQAFELALRPAPADPIELRLKAMRAYEALADEAEARDSEALRAAVLQACACCKGNRFVHGAYEVRILP